MLSVKLLLGGQALNTLTSYGMCKQYCMVVSQPQMTRVADLKDFKYTCIFMPLSLSLFKVEDDTFDHEVSLASY